MKLFAAILMFTILFQGRLYSQDKAVAAKDNYTNVITQRAAKIIAPLGITDSTKFYRVQQTVVAQYRALSSVHDTINARIKSLKATETNKELLAAAVKQLEDSRMQQLLVLHNTYIQALSAELTQEQVIAIKDGMTYGVLPITIKAYEAMLPDLTAEQKKQILLYLTEAREFAMDAESSDKKHAWFGKYKGRINNYLSAAGIDMKKAGQDWDARIKAQSKTSQN